jgi:hypothetical protein
LHEGWDFFAEDCRHLLLTFLATPQAAEERTLWIDDVVVTEQPSLRDGRLINPATLTYQPLEHRLQPGEQLSLTVDADKRLRETHREVGGVSFHRVAGWAKLPFDRQGRYVLPAELEEAIRQMRLPMTRFYALGDEPFGLETAIDKAAEFLDRIGVDQAATPLEFEIQGATSKLRLKLLRRSATAWTALSVPLLEIVNVPVARTGFCLAIVSGTFSGRQSGDPLYPRRPRSAWLSRIVLPGAITC